MFINNVYKRSSGKSHREQMNMGHGTWCGAGNVVSKCRQQEATGGPQAPPELGSGRNIEAREEQT